MNDGCGELQTLNFNLNANGRDYTLLLFDEPVLPLEPEPEELLLPFRIRLLLDEPVLPLDPEPDEPLLPFRMRLLLDEPVLPLDPEPEEPLLPFSSRSRAYCGET